MSLVVAELATSAVTHGLLPGHDVPLRLVRSPGRLRVEVSDPRGEHRPGPPECPPGADAEGGRGLLPVDQLAEEWGVAACDDGIGKTMWAVLPC